MREGELADHVAVISFGRVRVNVREGRHEHTLAERGAGDLIGERAALRAGLRSATVVALERVQALLLSTADFAAFVSEYPAVLRILEDQLFDRLTEGPRWSDHGGAGLCGQNCTIVYTDVVGFGAPSRKDVDRLVVRRATTDMTVAALDPFWAACSFDDRGDGLLVIVPPDVPTLTVLERLIAVLPGELAKHNSSHGPPERVQLRVAVIVGPIVADTMGVSGEAIIHAARMLDAPEFKQAMSEAEAPLGMIVSGFVYETVIKHGTDPLDPAGFAQVQVKVKESEMTAWMHFVNPAGPAPGGMSRDGLRTALRRSPLLGHLLAG
jgi:class 3 adenylate cyclase